MYERLKLICTCEWPIDLSGFDSTIISFLYFLYELFPLGRLKWYPIQAYRENDGTFNAKIKLVINKTPQIANN